MRYSASEKQEIIRLVEQSHLPITQTLQKLGVSKPTFYRWYKNWLEYGIEGLEDKSSAPSKIWNRIPDDIRDRVIEAALNVFYTRLNLTTLI